MEDDTILGGPIDFQFPQGDNPIIKVIGVGGGGGNAVNHMFNEGIHDVSFVVCNTDKKALEDSPVPNKLQLGEGLGAGNKPAVAEKATLESLDAIKNMLNDGTKMVFVTAGMGGGTGTGAAPIIAKTAKDMGLLTVGIVTIPFLWEGKKKIDQALDGVDKISGNVDALLIINNERLRTIYQQLSVVEAFAKADDTLCNAAKSIAEIITMRGRINLDFNDVKTVLKDGGVAIMSSGYGSGEGRVTKAIEDALNSPLLNNNDVYKSKKILLSISSTGNELMMDEMNEVNDFMTKLQNEQVETKWGLCSDSSLGDKVKVTILASGFGIQSVNTKEMDEHIKNSLENQQKAQQEAEEEAERKDTRRDIYYGKETGKPSPPRYKIFKFDNDSFLDNIDVINMVEGTPTYKRNSDILAQIREKAGTNNNVNPASGNAGVISF